MIPLYVNANYKTYHLWELMPNKYSLALLAFPKALACDDIALLLLLLLRQAPRSLEGGPSECQHYCCKLLGSEK